MLTHQTTASTCESLMPKVELVRQTYYVKPKAGLYQLSGRDAKTTVVIEKGALSEKYCDFDVRSFCIKHTDQIDEKGYDTPSSRFRFLPPWVFPRSEGDFPPILVQIKGVSPAIHKSLFLTLSHNKRISLIIEQWDSPFLSQMINQQLRMQYYTKYVFPVFVGSIPIFKETNTSAQELVRKFTKNFATSNPKNKLIEQREGLFAGYCHIQAHFICDVLDRFWGVYTIKAFKVWDIADWDAFPDCGHRAWAWHCAPAIVDAEGKVCVLDFWWDRDVCLRSFDEWVHPMHEPLPRFATLSNRSNIHDIAKGSRPETGDWYRMFSPENFEKMQALYAETLPQASPERPLALKAPSDLKTDGVRFFDEKKSPVKKRQNATDHVDEQPPQVDFHHSPQPGK